ncbi:hypothetical protein [Lichenicoccus sp.]|uniref:hypothetical protein n=1 Tax=Lichenicoccus sp. TaxID=2781899 RepID=UPI003D152D83
MTKAELDAIFSRVEDGVPDSELQRVADFVATSTDTSLQYRGLQILGWAHAREYAPLIASFLTRTDDLGLPFIAIRALVRWFQDAKPYVETLKSFLKGIPEDDGRDLQLGALQVAGEAYRQTADAEILQAILDFLDDENEVYQEQAQDSLVCAIASDWERLTPKQRHDLRVSFDSVDYLSQARERLGF